MELWNEIGDCPHCGREQVMLNGYGEDEVICQMCESNQPARKPMIDPDECPECGKLIDVDCDCDWENCMACHGKGEVDATGDDIHWITCPKCLGGGLYPSPKQQEPDEDSLYESHVDAEMEEL